MPRTTGLLTNFTAGEISPRLDMRVDTAKYRNGLAICENAIVMPHGGLRKRPGTKFVQEVKDSSQIPRLVPFEFSTEQAYMLEYGPSYIRHYKDQGIITAAAKTITGITKANPAVVTAASHGYSNGDQILISGVVGMVQMNNRRVTVANATSNTFECSGVNSSAYDAYVSGGSAFKPIETTTTYDQDEVDALSFAQSADTLYQAHPDNLIAKLTRSSHTSWSLAAAAIVNGPFRDINSDTTAYMTIGAATGSVATITGATKANPCVITTSAAHGFAEGATAAIASVSGMTELNGNKYVARNPTATTFELWSASEHKIDSTGFTTYTSGGTATPTTTKFGTLSPGTPVQLSSADFGFDTPHIGMLLRLWEPGKESGAGQVPLIDTTVANGDKVTNAGNVYGIDNLDAALKWFAQFSPPTHESGVVKKVTPAGDHSADVVFLHDSSSVVQIQSIVSGVVAGAVVVRNHVPSSVITSGTSLWEEGAWSTARGYPAVIALQESRLWAAGSDAEPQTVRASRTAAFEDFQDGPDDDDALIYPVASGKVDRFQWMMPGKILALGTASNEYAAAASSQREALTPSNVRLTPDTPYGSGSLLPVRVGPVVIFGQRRGLVSNPSRKLRELQYSFEADGFIAPDLTIVSEHITKTGITGMAYQADPDSVVWAHRTDGQMAALTYEAEQDVKGWHRHLLGGVNAKVLRAATIPGADGDELWLLVERTIGGGTRRYIEVLSPGLTDDIEKEDAIYLDSAVTYDGSATTTITGLWHMEGEAVEALADGVKVTGLTVANGTVTLPRAASLVHVGLKYTTIIETLDLEMGAASGTAKSRAKRINDVYLSLYRSLGGRSGYDADHMDNILYRTPEDPVGASVALRTLLVPFSFPSKWDREAVIRIVHDEPYPFMLLGIAEEQTTSG